MTNHIELVHDCLLLSSLRQIEDALRQERTQEEEDQEGQGGETDEVPPAQGGHDQPSLLTENEMDKIDHPGLL